MHPLNEHAQVQRSFESGSKSLKIIGFQSWLWVHGGSWKKRKQEGYKMTVQTLLRSLKKEKPVKRSLFQTIRLWDRAKRCEEEKKLARSWGRGRGASEGTPLPSPSLSAVFVNRCCHLVHLKLFASDAINRFQRENSTWYCRQKAFSKKASPCYSATTRTRAPGRRCPTATILKTKDSPGFLQTDQ